MDENPALVCRATLVTRGGAGAALLLAGLLASSVVLLAAGACLLGWSAYGALRG